MTREELAKQLDGRRYRSEITKAECAAAKASNLIVIFGASDDLIEIRGAINDELNAYLGKVFEIGEDGSILPDRQAEELEACQEYNGLSLVKRPPTAITVEALWCAPGSEYPWTYKATVPVATFDLLDLAECGLAHKKWCRGIVLDFAGRGEAL